MYDWEYTWRSINQRIGQTRNQMEREAITLIYSTWEGKVFTEFYDNLFNAVSSKTAIVKHIGAEGGLLN